MTDEQDTDEGADEPIGDEGAEEPIEDLEAPASAQEDVAGGEVIACPGKPSMGCWSPTCVQTEAFCQTKTTHDIVVYET
jgi:hypothetical protein